ncbi:rhodanese-like domain-containing protein [Variovorax sp. PCZ-1]|uniref:rhodanese-like domain-containing protein n=1 Tax=Variovorax sp. PCZ-1 TaxID=2835533 RepID=UPI001BCD98D0|nr:rhodanese-like domain-containing protein [Variovorax sp. PCZ-1]MBS7807545.1 sulfurtransferase [Variovorax sp. PCZ-1]
MIPQIRPAAFGQWLATQSDTTPLVLDVREPWETNTASIKPLADSPGFDVLFMPMQTIPQRLNELPADRPIACLCHHGMRSQQVAAFLLNRGFENVINISGGIDAWSHELDNTVAAY